MALEDYQRMRDFAATPEPAGKARPKSRKSQALQYCIQKHDATRLHYDFRLELDGTLKSWAIPRGQAGPWRAPAGRTRGRPPAGVRHL